MARPIKETPAITGKDAKTFTKKMAKMKFIIWEEREKYIKGNF